MIDISAWRKVHEAATPEEWRPAANRFEEEGEIYAGDMLIATVTRACDDAAILHYRHTYGALLDALDQRDATIAARDAEIARLQDLLDTERYKVAIGVQAVAKAVQGRQWLSEPGRGSYTYDDERYQAEFGAAIAEIDAALQPLRSIARDWSDCPRDPLRVAANRRAALQSPTDAAALKGPTDD